MINIGSGLLKRIDSYIPRDLRNHRFVIITDKRVKKLYGDTLQQYLQEKGYDVSLMAFPAGEHHKNRETKAKLESALIKKQYSRDTCIIALGGGVVGDMAGFIAATYMRGVPYIQVPTTLLAMIDSSVGGKTAVNTPEGKNMIGAFYEPRCVIADIECLDTLPQQQITNGWIEAIKIFMTCDAHLFKKAMNTNEPTLPLIKKAIALKSAIVEADPREQGLRAVLNFGHTMGHAIEKASNYKLLHGYAVGYGILVEATLSLSRGLINLKEHNHILTAMHRLGIKGSALKQYDLKQILRLMKRDKKVKDRAVRVILLNGIGAHLISDVSDNECQAAFNTVITGGL